jgi:hypothetical protein
MRSAGPATAGTVPTASPAQARPDRERLSDTRDIMAAPTTDRSRPEAHGDS